VLENGTRWKDFTQLVPSKNENQVKNKFYNLTNQYPRKKTQQYKQYGDDDQESTIKNIIQELQQYHSQTGATSEVAENDQA